MVLNHRAIFIFLWKWELKVAHELCLDYDLCIYMFLFVQGYENQDWFIPSPALQVDEADLKLSPDQIRETLNYFRKYKEWLYSLHRFKFENYKRKPTIFLYLYLWTRN